MTHDFMEVHENIVELMEKIGEPLTEHQRTALAGAIAIWFGIFWPDKEE